MSLTKDDAILIKHIVEEVIDSKVQPRFEQIDTRFEQVDARFGQIDQRFEKIDNKLTEFNGKFTQIGERFTQIDYRFEEVGGSFNQMSDKFIQLEKSIDKKLKKLEHAVFEEIARTNKYLRNYMDETFATKQEVALIKTAAYSVAGDIHTAIKHHEQAYH